MPTQTFYKTPDFDQVWKKFREICKREGSSYSEKIREYVARYVMVHEPGNPQLHLETFIGKPEKQCFKCQGIFPALRRVKFRSGLVASVCPICLENYVERGLVVKP